MSNTQTHVLNIENILFQAHLCRVELYRNSQEYRKATNELLDIISDRLVKKYGDMVQSNMSRELTIDFLARVFTEVDPSFLQDPEEDSL